MEIIMSVLLGILNLFYPLLIASFVIFIYALIKRSWIAMLISGLLLFPDAWYFSGYPPFPWVKFIPLVQVIMALVFYFKQKRKISSS